VNLPNKLTVSRIILTVFFMFVLFGQGLYFKSAALIIFMLASLTDFLDGYIARRNNLVTPFGQIMDPIADKVLILSAYMAFVELGLLSAWMALVIVAREILITGMRLYATTQGKIIPADIGGKHKTISQIAVIYLILIFLIFKESTVKFDSSWFERFIWIPVLITVILTVISGASYIIRNRSLFNVNGKTD